MWPVSGWKGKNKIIKRNRYLVDIKRVQNKGRVVHWWTHNLKIELNCPMVKSGSKAEKGKPSIIFFIFYESSF